MRKLSPTTIGLVALGTILLVMLIFLFTRSGDADKDKLGDDQVGTNVAADDPETRCAAQGTYDRIKRELFKRAAAVRGGDQAAYDKLVAYAVLRAETPILRGYDQRVNSVSCSAYLSLDLPPGVAVAGGRRTLNAEVGYAIQPAADGNGTVVTVTDADAIITPLATLARVGEEVGTTTGADNGLVAEPVGPVVEPSADEQPAPQPEPAPPPRSTNPSFDCDDARTRGELAVCNEPGLAALDRNMAAQYRRAIAAASPTQRAALVRTRDRFLGYRDRCQTNGCMRDAYVGRMQEIRDIMDGRWRP
jgi:uncharacterized protein YecT (DUF1311 family)